MSSIVLKLLCKIYKEGYFIRWDEEQCLIFANKAGREVQAAEVQGIIEILFIKGIMDKNSYLENGILTSENIQKVWMEATKRRKRELSELPYLMVKTEKEKENDKPEKESGKPDNASTQQEIERPKPLKEGKVAVGTGDVAVSPVSGEKQNPPSFLPPSPRGELRGVILYFPLLYFSLLYFIRD